MPSRVPGSLSGLHAGLLGCAVLLSAVVVSEASERIIIEAAETAGIRRFQYPVAVDLLLPSPVPRETRFRLVRENEPVLAQFRPAEPGPTAARWWLDFPVDLLPHQSLSYEVQYGADVAEGKSRSRGLRLIQSEDALGIVNEPHLSWTVPRDLDGLLHSVLAGELDYLAPDSAGLLLRDRNGTDHPLAGARNGSGANVRVTREGPLAVGLRFDFVQTESPLEGIRSTVDLVFPVFKSWVEVDWRMEDPQGKLGGAGVKLKMNLDPPARQAPTLIDFGATSLVYLSLNPGQHGRFSGDPRSWQVLRGVPDRMEPYVSSPKQTTAPVRPEGWAHVMDRRRCLAIAVDGFAAAGEDRMEVSAEGLAEFHRRFQTAESSSPSGSRRLRFWLHFVPFPPQQTAATSPQAMQTPVVTRIQTRRSP